MQFLEPSLQEGQFGELGKFSRALFHFRCLNVILLAVIIDWDRKNLCDVVNICICLTVSEHLYRRFSRKRAYSKSLVNFRELGFILDVECILLAVLPVSTLG